MPRELIGLFIFVFVLFLMQSLGGVFQIRNFKKSIRRVHNLGNVGIGQKRGRFFNGYLVILACDNNRIITGCEVMDGKTFLAKCHPIDTLIGKKLAGVSIDSFLEDFRSMDEKEQNIRRLLNFGHTVAHAVEADSNHSIRHGYAVAVGMIYESLYSLNNGYLKKDAFDLLCDTLSEFGYPLEYIPKNKNVFINAIKNDKKATRNGISLALTAGDLTGKIVNGVDPLDLYKLFL